MFTILDQDIALVASSIPKDLFYHWKKDASFIFRIFSGQKGFSSTDSFLLSDIQG